MTLREDLNEAVHILTAVTVRQEAICTEQQHLVEDVKTLMALVMQGNGHKPMTQRMDILEETAHRPAECPAIQTHLETHSKARARTVDLRDKWTLSVGGGIALLVFKDEIWPLLQLAWAALHSVH